jgi:hypothetical protein
VAVGVLTDPWQQIDSYLTARGVRIGRPTIGQTTGGSHTKGSLHFQRRARDYGDADSDLPAVWAALLPLAQGPGWTLEELFYDPGGGWDSGRSVGPIGGHRDHVHAGIGVGKSMPGGGARAPGSTSLRQGLAGLPIPDPRDILGNVPGLDQILDALASLPTEFFKVLTGGHTPLEVAVRTLEVFGGAVLLAVGLLMVVRIVMRGTAGGRGVSEAGRIGRRGARRARRQVRRLAPMAAGA